MANNTSRPFRKVNLQWSQPMDGWGFIALQREMMELIRHLETEARLQQLEKLDEMVGDDDDCPILEDIMKAYKKF